MNELNFEQIDLRSLVFMASPNYDPRVDEPYLDSLHAIEAQYPDLDLKTIALQPRSGVALSPTSEAPIVNAGFEYIPGPQQSWRESLGDLYAGVRRSRFATAIGGLATAVAIGGLFGASPAAAHEQISQQVVTPPVAFIPYCGDSEVGLTINNNTTQTVTVSDEFIDKDTGQIFIPNQEGLLAAGTSATIVPNAEENALYLADMKSAGQWRVSVVDPANIEPGTQMFDAGCGIESQPLPTNQHLNAPAVDIVPTLSGQGYWIADSSGEVANFGDASNLGSLNSIPESPIVGMTRTPNGQGYWLVSADGKTYAFGDSLALGDMVGKTLNSPIVNITATPSGKGYWLSAADGGVFAYGDAGFYGSMGGRHLNSPIVQMVPTPTGKGYWQVAQDGGIFAYGDAGFYGSMGGTHLNKPIIRMVATPTGNGYWLVATDGGIFAYGDAGFYGSMGGNPLNKPINGMAGRPDGQGYWLVGADGGVFAEHAPFFGSAT